MANCKLLYFLPVVFLPTFAFAQQSPQSLEGDTVATVRAITDFCSRVDPKDREYLEKVARQLIAGSGAGAHGSAHGEEGGKRQESTYDTVMDALKQTPPSVAAQNCAAPFVGLAHRRGDD